MIFSENRKDAAPDDGAASRRERQCGDQGRHPGKLIERTLATAKAEAADFTVIDGKRTMIAVFDLKSASDMPRIAEPIFMGVNGSVQLYPCMNADDLKAGLAMLG
jgi:hypothetical protein